MVGPRQRRILDRLAGGPCTLSALIHGDPLAAASLRALYARGLLRVINSAGKHDLAVWVEPAVGLLRQRASGSDLEALSARLQETGQAGGDAVSASPTDQARKPSNPRCFAVAHRSPASEPDCGLLARPQREIETRG